MRVAARDDYYKSWKIELQRTFNLAQL